MNSHCQTGGGFALVTMPGDSGSVRSGLERALGSAPLRRLLPCDRERVEVLLAEVLNNIVEHAYSQGEGEIRLLLRLEPTRLCLTIEDEGQPMPQGQLPEGQLPAAEALPEGGFGWFLIRSLSTEVGYMRRGNTNRLDIAMNCEQWGG
ncbi:ATP-binding protein [Xinfangfangia sp. D13-10-4-6]|uniref:ATP-binding protein n=1 Tax=Pseudogemmobacter hezensis TaxID=2737662 RepID=UPI0015519C4C|nr:ATP-binding protein [Pseudogemmobacter hezensis]NPD17735.1 ATP-binding protein [Pseudogemmobacter hezensis]